jgi:hypothetical protein
MKACRDDDLFIDGVRAVVDWDRLKVGDSAFLPCLNLSAAQRQLAAIFRRRKWTLRTAICVEKHVLGVRFWRTA